METNLARPVASNDPNHLTLNAPKEEPVFLAYPPPLLDAIAQHRALRKAHAAGFRIDASLDSAGLGRFTVLPKEVILQEQQLRGVILHGQLDFEQQVQRLVLRAPTTMPRKVAPALTPKKRTSKTRR